jgi:hypothetical protein
MELSQLKITFECLGLGADRGGGDSNSSQYIYFEAVQLNI